MQKKLILLLAIMTAATNTYAMQMTNAKLISARTIAGKDLKLSYKPLALTAGLKAKMKLPEVINEYTYLETAFNDGNKTAAAYDRVDLEGNNFMFIVNKGQSAEYKVTYTTCIMPANNPFPTNCSGNEEYYRINANGSTQDYNTFNVQHTFTEAGEYIVTSNIDIYNLDTQVLTTTSSQVNYTITAGTDPNSGPIIPIPDPTPIPVPAPSDPAQTK